MPLIELISYIVSRNVNAVEVGLLIHQLSKVEDIIQKIIDNAKAAHIFVKKLSMHSSCSINSIRIP
jgi:hypothetical protein